MEMLVLFIILSIVNVIIQTVKTIATVNCGKTVAAFVNAIAYGLYTVVVVYTASDEISLIAKVIITALTNFIGVYVVKYFMDKIKKERLWKVEMTVASGLTDKMHKELKHFGISHYWVNIGKYTVFNIFCPTKEASHFAKTLADKNHAKYFVTETKALF